MCENILCIETKVNPVKFLVKTKSDERVPSFEKVIPLEKNNTIKDIYNKRGTSCDIVYKGKFLGMIVKHNYYSRTKTREFEYMFDTKQKPPILYYKQLYKKLIKEDTNSYVVGQYYDPCVGFIGERYNGINNEYDFDEYIEWIDPLEKYAVKDEVQHLVELFADTINFYDVGEELDRIRNELNKEDKKKYKKRIGK